MKNFLKHLLILAALTAALPVQAIDWDNTKKPNAIPASVLQLNGTLKGKDQTGTFRNTYLHVFPLLEDGQLSGRFNIFLWDKDSSKGKVYEGYVIGGYRMALLPVMLTEDSNFVKPVPGNPLILELKPTKKGPVIALRDGSTQFEFDRISDDIQIGEIVPSGFFKKDGLELVSSQSGSESASVRVDGPAAGKMAGVFYTVFELSGLMVLREEKLSEGLNQYSGERIKMVMVSLDERGKRSVVVGTPTNNGEMFSVSYLKQK